MTGVRPPLSVRGRRFWRRAYRGQSPGFRAAAALTASVLAAGLITLVVGVDDGAGSSTLHVADGSGTGGPAGGTGGRQHHAHGGGTAGGGTGGSTGGATAGGAGGSTGATTGGSTGGSTGGHHGSTPGCVNKAGSTDHGVTANSITIAFPIPDLKGVQQAFAFSSNFSSENASDAIDAFVGDINDRGGINCRLIVAKKVTYNPSDDDQMRSLCKDWTVDHPVFAVIDPVGAWHDAAQLCLTQEHQTPFIGSWTTTSDFLAKGRPYLWWTGPDQCNVLRNLVSWAVSSKRITKTTKFGVVYSTSTDDQTAYNDCLLPALAKKGLQPTDHAELTYSETPNQSTTQAPLIASRFHAKHIGTVIPMLPFFQFVSWISGERAQGYAPRLLLSDYDQTLQIALGLVGESGTGNQPFPTPYREQLQDQQGPTYMLLGNNDFPPYQTALGNRCNAIWHTLKKYRHADDVETTGTAMTTCQNVSLFAVAATAAGNRLTRSGFAEQMARIHDFAGGVVPNLSFGPGTSAGPHLQRIVAVHNNLDDGCPHRKDGTNHGNCWLVKSPFREQALAPI